MRSERDKFDVIIAGGGPAGTSAAIHLANSGCSVLLAEQKKFPRPKLCGEFISPECWDHFVRLGVDREMSAARGAALTQTVFYSRRGQSVSVPSEWFGAGRALGLSRAEMDNNLLQRARAGGVTVREETQANRLIINDGVVQGASLKSDGRQIDLLGQVTVDATGRARVLARQFDKPTGKRKAGLVAFKAHVKNVRLSQGACELYFYAGGYGGLNAIEGGVANLCFIVPAKDVIRCESDPERLLREVLFKNSRAAFALENAELQSEWLAVALETFGRQSLTPIDGLLTAGDAAAFIDPFTGSGMLMALESGQLAAEVIVKHLNKGADYRSLQQLASAYRQAYSKKFNARLRVCRLLRRTAFVPQLAEMAIFLFGNDWLRHQLSRAVRHGTREVVELSTTSR